MLFTFGFHFDEICVPAENSEPDPILQALILSGPPEDEIHHHRHGPCVLLLGSSLIGSVKIHYAGSNGTNYLFRQNLEQHFKQNCQQNFRNNLFRQPTHNSECGVPIF